MAFTWAAIGIAAAAAAIGIGIKFVVPKLEDDNAIEEMAEQVIYKETGIDVDLTPNSPEKK